MGSVATPVWSQTRSCASLRARHLDGGASWTLELCGEADIATLALLTQELAQLAATNPSGAVVDVTHLVFCDVGSAELILAARRTCPLSVIGATGTVKRLFDLLDALQKQRLPRHQTGSHAPSEALMRTPVAV